jgi:hypothetical protein
VPTNQEISSAYAEAAARLDLEAMARMRHPDWQARWPQSGERVIGSDNYRRIVEAYPGGHPTSQVDRIVGAEDRWVVGREIQQIAGSGDFWWSEWTTHPDGPLPPGGPDELRDRLVWRETVLGRAVLGAGLVIRLNQRRRRPGN